MKRSFSWRVFTSFGLFLSFIAILLSGVLLYIFPGRAPGFVWEILGLSKPAWQNQHIIFGFAFSILSLCHLFFINWKAFFSYLKSKTKEGLQSSRELLVISVLALLCGFGTYFKIQPFSGILELGKSISNSWDKKGEQQSPDKRVERSGDSQELAFAEITPESGAWRDDFYGDVPYQGRGHGRERGHGHGYHNNNMQHSADAEVVPSAAPSQVLRQQEVAVKPVTVQNIADSGKSASNGDAPDDELHRRTTASCSSCH